MGVDLGKNLLALLGSTARTQAVTGHTVARTQAPKAAVKTAGYASIPYERAPQVLATVPTEGLLAGYSTPKHVWVA